MEIKLFKNINYGLFKSDAKVLEDYNETNKNKDPKVERKATRTERVGSFMVKYIASWPKHTFKFLTDPRVVTIALTALSLVAVSFAFYPAITHLVLQQTFTFIARTLLKTEAIKLFAWSWSCLSIIGLGARAYGRFDNEAFKGDLKKAQNVTVK